MLDPRDYSLSMKVSPRARRHSANEHLRSMIVHRLTEGAKSVWRRALAHEDRSSVYCEPCDIWVAVNTDAPSLWQCSSCQREYRIEFAIYEELEQE